MFLIHCCQDKMKNKKQPGYSRLTDFGILMWRSFLHTERGVTVTGDTEQCHGESPSSGLSGFLVYLSLTSLSRSDGEDKSCKKWTFIWKHRIPGEGGTQPFSITTFPSVVVELKALQSQGTSLLDNNHTTQLHVIIFRFHAFYFHRLPALFSFLFSPTSFIARVSRGWGEQC